MSRVASATLSIAAVCEDGSQRVDLGAVVVEASSAGTVADLCAAAEELHGDALAGRRWVALRSGSLVVDVSSVLAALDIVDGSSVELVWSAAAERELADHACESDSSADAESPFVWSLRTSESADEATATLVAPGRYRVGRDPLINDVVLDDASVSRTHAVIEVDRRVVVVDSGSTNGTTVAGQPVGDAVVVDDGAQLRFGDVTMTLALERGPSGAEGSSGVVGATGERVAHVDFDGTIRFGATQFLNRPPRLVARVQPVVLKAPKPPGTPAPPSVPWISGLVPVVMGVVLGFAMWKLSGGGAAVWTSSLFFLMSPMMVFGGYAESKRSRRREVIANQRRFERSLNRVVSAACDALEEQRGALEAQTPSLQTLMGRASHRDPRLWEATAAGELPSWRVGLGPVRSQVDVAEAADLATADVSDDLANRYQRLATEFAVHPSAPVVVSLQDQVAQACIGTPDDRTAMAQALVTQALVMLGPSAVEVSVIGDGAACARWNALAWTSTGLGGSWRGGCAGTKSERDDLIARVEEAEVADGVLRLVVVDDPTLDAGAMQRLVVGAKRRGARVLWCGASLRDAPAACSVVIDLTGPQTLVIHAETAEVAPVAPEVISPEGFEAVLRSIASLRERVSAGPFLSGGGNIEPFDAVFGLEVLRSPDPVLARWSEPSDTLEAPVGRDPHSGTVISLDLVADGPHALIAGTTGAGKSELLRALLSSIALHHPPTRASFLLIDYKGGSAFGELSELVHSAAMITDLDEHLVQRMLTSLSAEIRRRETLLRDAGAIDLCDYWRRRPDEMLPRLVIAVDEFASIANDVPGFLEGMVDIGRRGRSLGLHLVLATQRPAGVVTEHLRANVNLRVALRVADPSDSEDIVGVKSAAAIDRSTPGRAIVQISQRDPVELQSAYVGERRSDESLRGDAAPVRLVSLNAPFMTPGVSAGRGSGRDGHHGLPSDLARIVHRVNEAAGIAQLGPVPRPWREPVPTSLSVGEVLGRWSPNADALQVLVGIADQPSAQRQYPATLDIDGTSVAVFSEDLDETWAALESMVLSAATAYGPNRVRFDVIDGAGRVGQRIAPLAHVGSVIAADDFERIERLIVDLDTAPVADRTDLDDRPHRVVMMHHMAAVVAAASNRRARAVLDRLERLAVDGRAIGVTLIVTADRRRSVPYELFSALGTRLVMNVSDPELVAPGPAGLAASGAPRRGVLGGVVVQVLAPLDDHHLNGVVNQVDSDHGRHAHRPIETLPERVALSGLARHGAGHGVAPGWALTVGISDVTLGVATVDLAHGNLLVLGTVRSGKTTALRTLMDAAALAPEAMHRVGVVSGHGSTLDGCVDRVLDAHDHESLYGFVSEACWRSVGPTVIVVDDATELDPMALAALEPLVAQSRREPVRLVVAAETASVRSSFGTLVAQLRRERHVLALSPTPGDEDDVVGVPLLHGARYGVFGRAEYVVRGQTTLIQLAVEREWGNAPITDGTSAFLP